jgi:hypothetical protein
MANVDGYTPEELDDEGPAAEKAAAHESNEDTEAAEAADVAKGLDRPDIDGYPGD